MQVPVAFEFLTTPSFASFFPGGNAELISQIQALAQNQQEQQIYLWGESGSGKSHLLQACCQLAKLSGKESFYLAFVKDKLPAPELLEGLDEFDLVCLDDIQHIADHEPWQLALFNFYNNHRQNNHQLLIAADCPPIYLPFALLDLKTRMNWGLSLKIKTLTDEDLLGALNHRAHFLGFNLSASVGKFLLSQYAHDLPALWALMAEIDQATLAAKRRLTVPFLKKILAGLQHSHGE